MLLNVVVLTDSNVIFLPHNKNSETTIICILLAKKCFNYCNSDEVVQVVHYVVIMIML